MIRPSLVVLAMLAGCNDAASTNSRPDAPVVVADAAPLACGASGAAVVTGSLGGETISPVVRAIQIVLAGNPTIVIDESGTGCGDIDVNTTDYVALMYCAPATSASYPLSGSRPGACPGLSAGAAFGYTASNGSHPVEGALGGTLTIESPSGTCVTGSFSATFASGPVSGTFAAVICP